MLNNSSTIIFPSLSSPRGFALVAALMLMGLVALIGITILEVTSTELVMSGQVKSASQSFYVAEAGIEEGRSRLRGTPQTHSLFLGDPSTIPNPNWSAYLLTSSLWNYTEDPDFSGRDANYIPTSSLFENTSIIPNSLQTSLPYWVKLRHKTEFDAEQLGHQLDTPHYLDQDGNVAQHQRNNMGQVLFYGYPNLHSPTPLQFTTIDPTIFPPVYRLRSYGGREGPATIIEADVVHVPGPKRLAVVFANRGIVLQGANIVINGDDACLEAPSLPPVYALTVSNSGAHFLYHGLPVKPQTGSIHQNISQEVKILQGRMMSKTKILLQGQFGSSTQFVRTLLNPEGEGLFQDPIVQHTIGYGVLLVHGNVVLRGDVEWNGLILVSGSLRILGHEGGIVIRGEVLANEITAIEGQVSIQYDSCQVRAALHSLPLKILRWKEEF